MAALAMPLMAAGTVMNFVGGMRQASAIKAQGQAQQQQAAFEAAQRNQIARNERAASQREAAEQRRIARLAESRAIAIAAAQGGSVSDPTVQDILGDITSEGEYRAMTALFEGEQRARTQEMAARGRIHEGKAAKAGANARAGAQRINTLASTANAGSSLFEKYG